MGSPFVGPSAPITASDEQLREVLAEAELAPLLPAIAYATGDLSVLRDDLRPDPVLFVLPDAGLTPDQAAGIRELAHGALVRFRDGGSRVAPPPSDEVLLRIMEFAVGGVDMRAYLPLLEEELAHRSDDRRAPRWHRDDLAPDVPFRVAVIGAGMSGLLAAHRLRQAGLEPLVFEKNDDVGGTWYENRYPGCRVDNPNHSYSYSFAQRHDWPYHYSTQPVLHEYFSACCDAFGLRDHIRFRTEVVAATWSDADLRWTLQVRGADGAEETVVVDAVVSAVGQLNRPRYPTSIAGFGSFEGPAFHSAAWDHDVDLHGKRVAVIGTGASALQFVPEIAPVVGELLVLQRTPPYIGQNVDYHRPVSDELTWLYGHLPSYAEWHRFCIFWRLGDASLAAVRVDPAWEGDASVSALNDFMRQTLLGYLTTQLGDRPDLLEACTPRYPPGAKRIIQDNGVWAEALKRDNVRLLDGGAIRAITPKGILLEDGTEEVVDVLVYGTGFTASEFLTPMRVTGRGGVDLHEQWQGDARAYLGVTVPAFPNLFCLYGPNTNIVINGSIVFFSECGVRYVLELLGMAFRTGHRAVDIRVAVHDAFNEQVDAENRRMAWGASDVSSWYRNDLGRVAQNWPFTLLEYWQRTSTAVAEEYELLG